MLTPEERETAHEVLDTMLTSLDLAGVTDAQLDPGTAELVRFQRAARHKLGREPGERLNRDEAVAAATALDNMAALVRAVQAGKVPGAMRVSGDQVTLLKPGEPVWPEEEAATRALQLQQLRDACLREGGLL